MPSSEAGSLNRSPQTPFPCSPDSVLPSAPSVLAEPAAIVRARPAQKSGPLRTLDHSRHSADAALAATQLFCSRYMRLAASRRGWESTQAPTAAPHSTETRPSSRPHQAERTGAGGLAGEDKSRA